MIKRIICICISAMIALSLIGCGKELPNEITGDTRFGGTAMHTDLNTCGETSGYLMAETEAGYYLQLGNTLRYADKADLTAWIPVCNDPTCEHKLGNTQCSANLAWCQGFYLEEDRIYSIRERGENTTASVCSTALDGTDFREEYPVDSLDDCWAKNYKFLLTSEYAYTAETVMLNDGSFTNRFLRANEKGIETLYEGASGTNYAGFDAVIQMRGDLTFNLSWLSEDVICRATEDGYEEIRGMEDFNLRGSYLTGNMLFHSNGEGYYRTDLATRKSQKIMERQMARGTGYFLTDECVVESAWYSDNASNLREVWIFNGIEWESVAIDQEILPPEFALQPLALTTEHLFLYITCEQDGEAGCMLYSISLAEKYTLEYCGWFALI